MGLDLDLVESMCPHCGRGEETGVSLNITYNLTKMWCAATGERRLIDIDNKQAKCALPLLQSAYKELKAKPKKYKKFNPDNGWGTYEGLLEILSEIISQSERYPEATWKAWR